MGQPLGNLSALIGSRICHDLISPIGAIGNGLELLTMTKTTDSPEMDLISESVNNATTRIRFFRIAYGHASPDQITGQSETCAILADLTRNSRLNINWNVDEDSPRAQVRLAFLALQCFESAMPFGGRIMISHENNRWTVTGTADKLLIDNALWGNLSLENPTTDVRPSEVQFALLPLLLADMNRRLNARIGTTEITATF